MPVTFECAGNGRALLAAASAQPALADRGRRHRGVGRHAAQAAARRGGRAASGAVEVLFTGLDHGFEGGVAAGLRARAGARRPGDALLAYEMNGAPLPPQHGFPLRLVVPGWYGMTNVKWLARITLLEEPFEGYQNSVAYRMYDADGEPGEPVTRMLPRSLMVPPGRARLHDPQALPGARSGRPCAAAPGRGSGRSSAWRCRRTAARASRTPRSTSRSAPPPGAAGASPGTPRRASTCCARARRDAAGNTQPLDAALEPQGLRQQRRRAHRRSVGRCLRLPAPCASSRGIQPTGRKHLGNYIGAIRGYLEGQERADPAIYCIVDLHATGVAYDPDALPGLRARHDGDADRRRARPRALHPVPPVRRAASTPS